MPDEIDIANEHAERILSAQIAAARAKLALPENLTHCLNGCGDPPADGSRYCCPDCARDHEGRMLVRQRQAAR
ncbi:hypothetical protein [Burkholderia mayonis]|uniref:Conjugal transfer protein TraR n=1 Tax=Burkholderia mayonis TaxID=1385591 RepID=A0A1B4G123_9BURK|nr:hypothetical protein [Burkholderia mayonis]AOJ09629.1 hypothetical protein WS71_20135 [Burkholderia mayonis]KVE52250.1 hypothetical protein WS71_09960 [Burkholderia mayonis]